MRVRRTAAYLVSLGVLACAGPALRHLDNRPFLLAEDPIAFPGGWIAVDACAEGTHALVELEIEALGEETQQELGFGIVVASGLAWGPNAFAVDGPVCRPRVTRPQGSELPPDDPHNEYCAYILRGQFELAKLPAAGDTVYIRRRGALTPLIWPHRR